MSTNTFFDLQNLYKTYFGSSPYFVAKDKSTPSETESYTLTKNPNPRGTIFYTKKGIALNKIGAYGKDVWFPITFWKSNKQVIEIEACTIGVNLTKVITKTVVSERKGTVKEVFSIDDYRFSIKGFLIDKNRVFPENQIMTLKDIFETTEPIELHGGYPEMFLDESCKVVITSLDFPEVQGKSVHIRPFTMQLESDYIQDLEL